MPGVETKIWLSLKGHIEGLPPSLDLPKAWPGTAFEQPGQQPYLRIGRVSASPDRVLIDYGKKHERRGSLIITLVRPVAAPQLPEYYDDLAAQIAVHFKDGTNMRYRDICVTVREYPHVQAGFEDEGWWNVPITIPWRTFA